MVSIKKMFVVKEMEFISLFHQWLTDMELEGSSDIRKSTFDIRFDIDTWITKIKAKAEMVDGLFDPILHKDILFAITIINAMKEKRDVLRFRPSSSEAFLSADKELKATVNQYYQLIDKDLLVEYHKLKYYSLSFIGKLIYNIMYKFLLFEKYIN